ncbi:hypothetical protein [Escherichia coli]|nr:hypothetical protein [Escherichia coli]
MELHDFELNYIEKWLPEASVKYKDGSPAVNLPCATADAGRLGACFVV